MIDLKNILAAIEAMPLDEKIQHINEIKKELHNISPFKNEPVDCVLWVKNTEVHANDYNPNSVAPPEMELLKVSIDADGYTQPIVSMPDNNNTYEVIDGFHRHRVGKEDSEICRRVNGYLPIVQIREEQYDKTKRMASTIRHNRARGKHKVEAMSDIVVELKRRNWSNERISRELGMDEDEVLRLCQITGLSELFSDQEFSASWDVEGSITEDDFVELTDNVETYGDETDNFRTVNTSDENRIFHTYDKWECYQHGFYSTTMPGVNKAEAEEMYRDFLRNIPEFEEALAHITANWKNSCEHYLTNSAMNRIAWLGQASACYKKGLPSTYRGGYNLLTKDEQDRADEMAFVYLNKWLTANGLEAVASIDAARTDRQSEIY